MVETQIKKFIQESIKEIRESLPQDFRIDDKIHFEIAVVTDAKAKGGLDIKIASVGADTSSQNIHKLKFSIVDEKAQKKAWQMGCSIVTKVLAILSELDANQTKKIEKKAKKCLETH